MKLDTTKPDSAEEANSDDVTESSRTSDEDMNEGGGNDKDAPHSKSPTSPSAKQEHSPPT